MAAALGIVFGLLLLATMLVNVVLAWGKAFRRVGRWLDPRIYALFPRLGHLFVDEDQLEGPGGESPPDPAAPDESAFGR